MKKFLTLILCCCMLMACSDNNKNSVSENVSEIPSVADGEVGEIITPDEKSHSHIEVFDFLIQTA